MLLLLACHGPEPQGGLTFEELYLMEKPVSARGSAWDLDKRCRFCPGPWPRPAATRQPFTSRPDVPNTQIVQPEISMHLSGMARVPVGRGR